ncbi:unnamed protein product [Clonostachys rosea f. rosea IK726]|uniref:Uncharacterized protein n=2 Tax=Bionectria ochroleuca TaxID=29856 RepID=A0A0B7K000_BIOOC|nr:unnamed protein product [Clonostachys rosea f. rosea IK726]
MSCQLVASFTLRTIDNPCLAAANLFYFGSDGTPRGPAMQPYHVRQRSAANHWNHLAKGGGNFLSKAPQRVWTLLSVSPTQDRVTYHAI